MRGLEHEITLTPGFSDQAYNEHWRVWIDFNKDGDFDDADETVFKGDSKEAITGIIDIANSNTLGLTRMRVSMHYFEDGVNPEFGPCDVFEYGEVEDYTINIVEFNCPAVGTACDDGNPSTVNDQADGLCNCEGEIITVACPSIDFNYQAIKSYTNNQDKGTYTIVEDGAGMMITGNAWKYISYDYVVTSETVIEFDFKSTVEGEIHGIGIDNNNSYSAGQVFNLYGTSSWGINDFTTYSGSGEYEHFVIPVGQYLAGNYNRITFAADHDANPHNGNSFFKNVKIYDGTCESTVVTGCGTGTITQDSWWNIPGYNLNDVPWNTTPGTSGTLNSFESATEVADQFGTRIRGYICPPQSGYYTFWISSDDFGELYLSSNEDLNGATRIARVDGFTTQYEWDRYSSQKSAQIYLEAGQQYYIAAYMKEHGGYDHLEVGWQFPDGTMDRPISGMHLSPYDGLSTDAISGSGISQIGTQTANTMSTPNTESYDIKVYPNPAIDVIKVDVSDFIGQDVEVILSNNFGQTVLTQYYDNLQEVVLSFDLNQPGMGNGFYNVSVISNNTVIAKPFIISASQD